MIQLLFSEILRENDAYEGDMQANFCLPQMRIHVPKQSFYDA